MVVLFFNDRWPLFQKFDSFNHWNGNYNVECWYWYHADLKCKYMLNNFKNNPNSNDVNGFRVRLHIAYPFVSKRATEDEVNHHAKYSAFWVAPKIYHYCRAFSILCCFAPMWEWLKKKTWPLRRKQRYRE